MSRYKIATNINIDLEFELVPFHIRFVAWVIDILLFMIYYFLLFKFMSSLSDLGRENEYWLFITLMLPIALYHVVLESTMQGQTIGKKVMKIKVINELGGNATLSQYIIRWMLRVSDMIMIVMIILFAIFQAAMLYKFLFFSAFAITDIFCVALTKKGQRLGDIAAGTILIRTNSVADINETVFMEIDDAYIPKYPEVMRLSDRDLNMVKTIYNTVVKKDNYQLASRTADKICRVLNIQTKQDPQDFLETLLKDYNYLSIK